MSESRAVNIRELIFAHRPKNGSYYLVAIDGRGGAGKTSLFDHLKKLLPEFTFVCADDYFEPIEHPIAWGGYNEERFYEDVILPLKNSKKEFHHRAYDWDNEPHLKDEKLTIQTGVVIDRIYSFSFDLNYDFKIWVETPREITLERGISRSTMPKDRAEKVWRELWKPMEDKYILDTKPDKIADLVVDGAVEYDVQITG